MAPEKNGRVVFIGNIPYGVSEEQIIDTFGRVGSVNNFRLVHDKETGRPKGFGFLEFADPDAAASAVRNLNDHEIMGRKLRVDWSNDNSGGGNNNDNSNNMQQSHPGDGSNQQPPVLPPLPPGTDLPAGLTCPDAISKTLSAIPAPQLLDIISQMKSLVMSDPNQATELLRQAPQLAYAIFQALLLLGLVDTSMLSSIVQASAPQNPQFPAGAPVPPPPMPQPPQGAYAPTPQPGYPGYPPQNYQQPTPPVQQPAFAPPPPPQQAAAANQPTRPRIAPADYRSARSARIFVRHSGTSTIVDKIRNRSSRRKSVTVRSRYNQIFPNFLSYPVNCSKEELRGAWGRHKRDDPAPATIDGPNTFVSGRTCVISALGLRFSSANHLRLDDNRYNSKVLICLPATRAALAVKPLVVLRARTVVRSKNSTSSSKRKKADRSSRRPESVASSSAHHKHSRNDERSSKTEPRNSTSARSPVNDSSGPSSYYTTSDRLHQLEPRSLTEEAIRTLSMQDDGCGDAYSHAEDLPPGDAHADKIPRSHRAYKDEAGPRYNESLEHHSPAENIESNERSLPYKDEPQTSFGTSSHVQDQFPGQDPSTFARSAFNPTMAQDAAATYYNGYRVQPTFSAINQFPQSGPGAAAEYYSQASMQPSEAGNQHVPVQAFNAPQNTFHRPTGQTTFSNSPSYPANSYTTGQTDSQANVNAATDLSGQNYTHQEPYRPTEAFVQEHSTSHEACHQHSQSEPYATTYTNQSYNTPSPSQLPGYGKQPLTNHNLPHVAAAGAAAVAGSQSFHHKMHHHTHSAPFGSNNGGKMYSSPRPYTSGSMAMQHKHKGPISRFVDWWKDYEDVRKMEEYTEYIGVCNTIEEVDGLLIHCEDAPVIRSVALTPTGPSMAELTRMRGITHQTANVVARKPAGWVLVSLRMAFQRSESLYGKTLETLTTPTVSNREERVTSRDVERSERINDHRRMYPDDQNTPGLSRNVVKTAVIKAPIQALLQKPIQKSKSIAGSDPRTLWFAEAHVSNSFTLILTTARRSKQSKKGFFNFANSSSSSADSGLAFGGRPSKNGSTSRRVTKKSSDEHLKATLLGIGATAAAISAVQRGKSGSKKSNRTRPRNQDIRYGTQRSKADTSEEDGWESATDDESVSSGLAFGDFDGKVPRWQRRSESITSQSSGTDKWSWRWRRKPNKKITADDMSQDYHEDTYSGKEPSVASSQPLQYVHPVPISSPMYSETRSDPSMPGAFPEKQYASERIPIQQPQPVVPLQSNILHDQTPPHASQFDQPSPRVTTRPTIPTELRRTQSSPVSSHTMRNAAIAGLAGAAAAGILSNGRSRARDDSPSNVRFELTEKQAQKEERQQRKDDAKESRERAKVEARENKERARLDRARAMQEESERVAAENARRYAEEAERQKFLADQDEEHQARLQKAADAEAREREEDRQREEEIKEFMKNALAEQAREAEAKKQREAWESHRMAATGQISSPDSRAGPSTNSTPAGDRSQGYSGDRSQQDGNSSTNMPYTTRSYEPSNEHSGQPLMDDDLIDPDFFTRRRSHSELARHEELARKAAAKIIADLEDKYKDPAPSQAEFFAPKELFEPSKGKTKVHGPIDDDTDYRVYHMTEDQAASMPKEPPPPYQPSYQFANLRDLKGTAPWDIPKLNVIAPTPPASYAGSAKGDKSPISASKKDVRKPSQKSDTDIEPQKSSKVSWGEDQTRFYEITTPQSSQEQISSELPHGEYGSRTGYVNPESAKAEFSDSRDVTDNANSSNDEVDEPIEEIFRDPLFTSSGRLYQQPFVESVDDISFTMDSPGTEGAPPVQGFIEGEIDDVDEIENQMPHVPGGFEDTTPAPQSEDTFNTDIQNLSREVMQEQQAPRRYEPSQQSEPSQFSDRDQDDYFTTGKQRRRRDNEARRTSLDQDRDRQLPVHDHRAASPTYQTHAELTENDPAPKQKHSTLKSGLPDDLSNAKQSSGYAVAGAMAGAAAAVGALVNNDSSRYATRRMSEPEVERQRESRSQSQPRDTVSRSTPTSPVYERRQSLPSHAFDDLDMLPGSKRPKKSKRNSLLNYPTIGSPLRSAMTWDEYIEPLDTAQHDKPARSQSDENWDDLENPVEDTNMEIKKDLPSPESERGAASVVSAPVGDEENGRRRKSRKSHREREGSTSPRRSASVAMSEPFEGSRRHKRRSHRDDDGFEDATSARSRSSHSSKRDEDESRSKKKGGILSLFRRKTSDDILSNEQKRTNGDDERSKHHHRRHSSEYAVDEFNERRGSTSRSRSHAEKDEASSRHSSSSRHRRRHHRDGSVDEDDAGSQVSESRRRHKHRSRDHSRSPEKEFNDTQSQASESRRRHRHRDRDLDLDDRRSLSRGSKIINDEDKSFLVERVEDEEPTPLPVDDVLSSSQAPASVEQSQEPISRILQMSRPSPSESLSPPLEHMTPARPIVPLRISSSTAVPLRFRCPPTSPGLPRERSASFSSSVAQSPSSPITPKAKRPLSTEFMHSTEFRPLYLLERTRKPQEQEAEQNLPSLPPSRSASSSSLQSSEDWQSAAEDFEPGEQDDLGAPAFDQFHTDEPEDVLDSAQTTPKATEFPKHVLESRPHLEPEYYTWSDMEREEHLRREAENEHHDKQKEEVPPPSDEQTGPISAENTISPSADTEIAVNQDPMATDVWGEMSDEEFPSTEVPVREDSAEPTTQPQESEAGSNPAVLTKKHKNKKAPKLGTSSVSELTSPVRETPAELARRREKDAQDAVDTWFKPEAKPNQESPDNASLVPLPESTTPTEKETSGPAQDSEVPTPEIEPGSPLLSRKKSKKGKKKQKSVVLDEPDPEPAPSEKPQEPQLIANMEPQQEVPVEVQAQVEIEEGQTRTVFEETAQGQESVPAPSETVSPTEHIVESATPLDDMHSHDDAQTEEPVYTMSKAERKKNKKKAKKAALSIAVPVIAGAVSATSKEHDTEELAAETEPALVKDREDKRPDDEMPGDAIKPSSEIDTKEQQVAAAEPMSPSHPHAELPPEQVALPQEIHNYMTELEAVDPAAELATESTHVPEAPLKEQTQPKSGEVLEEEPQNPSDTAPEATSIRSSWFSWLPGSKNQITEDSMAESKAPEHEPEEAIALTQEPFERLLEQPMLHPEFVDESNASSDASKDVTGLNPREVDQSETLATTEEIQNEDSFVEDTKVPTGQPQLEGDLPPTTQVSTEKTEDVEIVESTRPVPQDDLLSAEATPHTFEHAPAMEESTADLQHSNAADASNNVLDTLGKMSHAPQEEDHASEPDEDPEPAEDLWTMPSKKSKKGKKAKKAAKEKALSEVASPSPIITENKSLDHSYLPSDNSNIIESANTIEVAEPEPLSNADTQVSSIDVLADEPASGTSVVEDTGFSAAQILEATGQDDFSEAVSQVPEPDAECPKATVIPVLPDAQSATAGEVEQNRIDEPVNNAEPLTATAEDEWAMPSSKKKKKKGKKGKQPLTEIDDSTQDVPATKPPEIQLPEVSGAIEQTPVTPDVFQTPAEDLTAQYFATPADELAGQHFVTPFEESPEQKLAVSAGEAEPSPAVQEHDSESKPHELLRDLSVTPTQNTQDESAVLVHEPLTLELSNQTDTTAGGTTREVASQADAAVPAFDDAKNRETDFQDESKPLGYERVVEPPPEPTPEPSSATTQIEPIDRSASTPEIDLPKDMDAHLEPATEEKSLPEPETSDKIPSTSSESDVLDAAPAELELQATAESIAFTTISTKKSKKDKKKTKKAKQQEVGSEPFQDEVADLDSPTAPIEASELPIELKAESSETNDVSIPSEPQQLPEIEAVVEEKPIARKLSKKEKRKAKKAAVSGRATPFEDTPEQATMNQDVTSYFPDTTEHDAVADSREVEPSGEPQAEVLSNATVKDVTANVTSAAHDLDTTENPLHEAQPESTNLNERDVLPAEVDPKEPADLSNDAQKDGQEISPQVIEPEPADVKDQAPGILDQLILAQESAVVPERELVYNDESPVDMPSVEAEDHTASLDNGFTPAEPNIESLGREKPVSKTETLAENVEEPTARDELEPEEGPVLKSASEEQSQAVADLAPPKMSKKDKRKAKKLKQTVEPTLESSDPVDNQITETEPSLPIVEEGIQPLETLDQETPEITDDVVPGQPTKDTEPFTANLSKKAKKKAKETKTKSTGFDDENDDPSPMLPESGADLTAPSREDCVERSVIEPFQTPSTEPVAQVGSETETGLYLEPTTLLGKDLIQDLEVSMGSAPEHSVDYREVTEITTQLIDDLEHVSDPQSADADTSESAAKDIEGLPTGQIAETARDDDSSRQVPPEYEANDKTKIVEAHEDPQVVDNKVTPATAPVHNETNPPEDKIPETLVPEQEDDFFTVTTSKKKKKGKNAKLQQETVVTEVLDDKSLSEPSNDAEKSAADPIESPQDKPDMPMATMVESKIQPIPEEKPSTALADEWELPTKKSKKEKRKAKKLQNLEDDLPSESIKQEPVVEPAMAEEAKGISAPPTSQATESVPSGAEPESVVDPDANDDWSFSRKLSKKEKRKNKKASIIDELPKGIEPVAMTENASEVQNAHSSDQTSENSDVKLDPTECGREETSSAGDIIAVEDASSEPAIQENEAAPTKDKEPASTFVNVSQDIDFAATLAAGLQDSGFDPSLVIDDPVFHRRASPTSVGEADPGEVTTTTKRRSKKSTGQSGHASPLQDVSREPPSIETSQPTEGSTNDDFSDALTASLIASGFAPNALANLSPDIKDAQAEPEEFSFAIPKRKKKGKKSTRTEMTTSEAPAPTDKPESQVSESDIRKSIPAEIDKVPTQEPKAAQEEIPTIGTDVDGPTGASPKRSASPTFFHTSEVSQFLPVSIDHLVQSSKEFVELSPQQSADPSMIETMAKDIPQPTLEDANAAPTTDSPRLPAPATIYKEPATWSFDKLESPTMEQIPNPDQAVLENDPFVSSNLVPETEEQIAEAEPISPVESTTKDRTSYLFQSPVNMAGLDKDKDFLKSSWARTRIPGHERHLHLYHRVLHNASSTKSFPPASKLARPSTACSSSRSVTAFDQKEDQRQYPVLIEAAWTTEFRCCDLWTQIGHSVATGSKPDR
ncbi:hypothetical protein KCU81_g131, partial [Aureobasidium melanogenum]